MSESISRVAAPHYQGQRTTAAKESPTVLADAVILELHRYSRGFTVPELRCFYSWQSDLPSSINRNFILNSLKTSLKQLKNEFDVTLTTRIDSDARGETGSPSIVDAIFSHIDECDVFLADVTNIVPNSFRAVLKLA